MEKKNILIVDDSSMMRNFIKKDLNDLEFNIAEAVNGDEALEVINGGFVPDLITLDKDMPIMDGFETCKKLRTFKYAHKFSKFKQSKVPVIFITASETVEDRIKGFNLGAMDFITKPFIKGELYDKVISILFPHKSLTGTTVMVVDDSLTARLSILQPLIAEGVKVIEAEDGIVAYETICKKMSEVDMIITDLVMPGMDGLEFCRKIRKELWLKDIPIIFLTGTDELHRILEIFKSGGTDYLPKPFVKEEMMARILVHLDKTRLNKKLRKTVLDLQDNLKINNEFTAMLTHDMKTPLNGIIGFSELLESAGNLQPEEKENVVLIKKSGTTLLELVNDIIDLSGAKSDRKIEDFKQLSINMIAAQSIKAVSSLSEKKDQKINFNQPPEQFFINGHNSSMMRVVNNLLGNAIKFSPRGTVIDVSVKAGKKPDTVSIIVKDNGIGIPPDKLPYLFDKFSRLSREGTEGEASTGLGMAIVKEVVEAHEGTIDVVSTPNIGSSFKINLPLIQKQKVVYEEEEKPESYKETVNFEDSEILIVEDNPVNRIIISKILGNFGCKVVDAENGEEALKIVEKSSNRFSMILMDRYMPVMDGFEATKELRKRGIKIPIIAMSADSTDYNKKEFLEIGMDAFLPKPISHQEVLKTLKKWVKPPPL